LVSNILKTSITFFRENCISLLHANGITISGFDNSKKYMMKPVDNMASNDVNIPQDSCTTLSLNTDGSLFHSAGLTDSKLRNRKWFLNTVSKRISQTALPNECQVCQCVADHTGMAKAICRKCYSSISDVSMKVSLMILLAHYNVINQN
jgi:hypothetical protein